MQFAIASMAAVAVIVLALAWMNVSAQETRAEFFRSCSSSGGFPVWETVREGPSCKTEPK